MPEDNFSFVTWIKTINGEMGISGVRNDANNAFDRDIYLTGGRVVCYLWKAGAIAMTGGPVINDGKWHQIAWTLDATNGSIVYVDGKEVASNAGATVSTFNWESQLTVGYSRKKGWADGSIDEFQVFNKALSAADVRGHYEMGRP